MDLAPPVLSRRLAAILAADAVGYSGLMAVDEVGTHRTTMSLIVEVFLPRIEAYKGETIRHTGDGLLAVFDSVTGAVECALEIQAELAARKAQDDAAQKVDFRIGVNFGDVIVEAADIYGDDVNLAVRLEGLAPPGGVCVSADVYQQVRRNIDAPFTDAGRHRVKNIPDPVHAYIVAPQGVRLGRSAAQSRRITTAAAIFAAALVLFVGTWIGVSEYAERNAAEEPAIARPSKPSIAVLPFDYVSGDPSYLYLGDGISDELITGLSRVSGLFVIARNSSFSFRGEKQRITSVARALGVRYVVEGSVIVPRSAVTGQPPDRLKINVRLVDGDTGRQLWADAYNDRFDDIVSVQERLSARVIAGISANLELPSATPLASSSEVALLSQKDTENPDAYRAFLKGQAAYRQRTPEAYHQALAELNKAVGLDPKFVRAHGVLAAVYLDIRTLGWYADSALADIGLNRPRTDARVEEHRQTAMSASSPPPIALQVTARIRSRQGLIEAAVAAAEKAVALSPNDAESHARLSLVQAWNGEGGKAIASAETAMRLDPRFPPRYMSYHGIARFVAEYYTGAASSLRTAVARNPENTLARVHLIATLGQLALRTEAAGDAATAARHREAGKAEMDALNRIRAETGLQPRVYHLAFARDRALYRFDTDLDRFLDGLRTIGLPPGGARPEGSN